VKRWKRRSIEEVEDNLDEEDLEEDEDFDDFDEVSTMSEVKWNELESKIRAGKYRPKHSDPWTLHVLYSNLRDLGKI
jgi:putative alpha-1,2-mannosidase